jgi:hypothetical protein
MIMSELHMMSLKINNYNEMKSYFESKEFQYENISGIGFEKGVTRRDNSDILKFDGKYYENGSGFFR